ncbi:MAG: 2OG-Fe(II) oxygenase [Crocosphaera sp.]
MTGYCCVFIIGLIFLITGIAKALNSQQFILHNYRYNLLPSQLVLPTAIAFIGIESALGLALILYEFPQWLIPSSIILLLCLSLLNYWSTSTGRTEDCGCYGGLLIVTPKQSLLLNLGYIFLLGIAWFNLIPNHQTQPWQWILTLIILVTTSFLAWQSKDKPLIDFSRLKPGNRWRKRWLKNSPYELEKDSYFVVFLGKTCPYCHKWIPLLNMMNTQKDLPQVMGILSLNQEEIEEFKQEQMVQFPLVSMDRLLFSYMIDGVPTGVLIEAGIIKNKYVGSLPEEFVKRIKQSYQEAIIKKSPKKEEIKPTESTPFNCQKIAITPDHHYLQIDDFLSPEELSNLLEYTINQKAAFVPAKTTTEEADYRQSLVLHSFPEFSEIIQHKISNNLSDIVNKLELPSFMVSQIETQLTAHNDGNYFKLHNDNSSWETMNRELTYVYYFYRQPKPFSGGELLIYESKLENDSYSKGDLFKTIEPLHNSLVIFPSHYFHEVLPVDCSQCTFADSRFTINGWIRKSLFN